MERRRIVTAALAVTTALLLLVACDGRGGAPTATPDPNLPAEQPVTVIPLAGPIADEDAEVSGMDWYGDYLILLPQYPARVSGEGDGAVFALAKTDVLGVIDGTLEARLQPLEIPFVASGVPDQIEGFEGFEAIAFVDSRVFLTIEARAGGVMHSYLVTGTMALGPDSSELRLDPASLVEVPLPADLDNQSCEAIVITGDFLVLIYEANGVAVNPEPEAYLFDQTPAFLGTIQFPSVEYRVTDATVADTAGRFWAINYFYPGDADLRPEWDPLAEGYGEGATHLQYETVERLVEFRPTGEGVGLASTPPIQLQLIDDDHARNWEGIVRLDARGFLLVTDKFPETILGFVPLPRP